MLHIVSVFSKKCFTNTITITRIPIMAIILSLTTCAACRVAATTCTLQVVTWAVTMLWCGSSYSTIYQVWSSQAFPFQRYGWFLVPALIGLVTLTTDLFHPSIHLQSLNGGHWSPVSWASFLSIYSFVHPSTLDLVRHGIDGRTDQRQPSMLNAPTLQGRGIIL